MGAYFDFDRFISAIPQILPSMGITFLIVGVSIVIGTLLAVVIALIRIKGVPVLKQLLAVYVSFMRGTPLLVQMMLIYYGLPLLVYRLLGVNINRWDTLIFVIIAYILNEAAFLGELFRSSILSIDATQTEAGLAVGMTGFQTFVRIVLPQAVKVVIPSFGTDLIALFQNSSLVYMLGVIDIMGRAKSVGTATGHSLEPYIFVSLLYISISLIMKLVFNGVDKRTNYGRRHGNVV